MPTPTLPPPPEILPVTGSKVSHPADTGMIVGMIVAAVLLLLFVRRRYLV
jgi:hypothetical protein